MTQEDKELLLKDLCARLPYNVVINCTEEDDEKTNFNCFLTPDMIKDIKSETAYWIIKPYLRSMSSMTKEEKREFQSFYPGRFGSQWLDVEKGEIEIFECSSTIKLYLNNNVEIVDWFNAHHFDYRGLIEKGLALEVPEGLY